MNDHSGTKYHFNLQWKLSCHTCCLFPSLWYHWSAEPGMAVPPSPKSHLLQFTAASTPTADTWSVELGRERLLIHDCVSSQTLLWIWPKPHSVPEQQETQACRQEANLSFSNQGLQVATAMLLLCASGCCHSCLCHEIRKATITCREITVLLISCSSMVLYTCFLASKCLCLWDRK